MAHLRSLVFLFPCVTLGVGGVVAQDECGNAVPVFQGANGPFTNLGATTSSTPWPCGPGGNDVWYVYTAPAAGLLTADLCGGSPANFDPILQILDGCGGTSLGCTDNTCGVLPSVTVPVAACTAYMIRVGGINGQTGSFMLNINGPSGPPCGGVLATALTHGAGCGQQFASFYELFSSSAAFDLANTCIQMTNTGNGYIVTQGGTYNPVGSLGTPITLGLTDDSAGQFGTLGVTVCSNGFVSLAPGNGSSPNPTVASFLSRPATAFYSWHDLNPLAPGGGRIKYEESGMLAQITYDGVWDYGGSSAASANFIQFQINTATGSAVICWGAMSGGGNSHLVGYSPGGPNLDPGSRDLSTLGASAIVTSGIDVAGLSLMSSNRPVQGIAAASFDVVTGNIPASAVMHIGILGVSSPGFALGMIGAPSCLLHASLDVLNGSAIGPGNTSQTWAGIGLPALPPSYAGYQFFLQGAILGTQQNPALGLGVLTSNGLLCTIGTY